MMKIMLFPWAKTMRNGEKHPKNYPFWPQLVELLLDNGHQLTQVGVEGEERVVEDFRSGLSHSDLCQLVRTYDTWIGVDSYGQHMAWSAGVRGIAIFGQSDPLIFGHSENVNLLKSRSYLRQQQFWLWEQCSADDSVWVTPGEVVDALNKHFS